ncbi:DUF2771 domain-containing protein [Streptomyces hoynatensis]|uniref:DUF2771 domain-containing protein n=1 Tax=Streptomyces hoynatensis TaxID=1141874 RepID=A0A3A9Z307_9ACTN|nr:DUF2771 domain-containing protein [Streptomyces hoynatensis]RKN41717.1 DUF2771 domain-containing protein [Streptomyces hoynatensis]
MTAISRSRGRRAIRTTIALGAVSAGLAALTGCEKPSPSAHFTLHSNTTSRAASDDCYGHGEALSADQALDCADDDEGIPSFGTTQGDTFRVGVDPKVADNGWLLFVNGLLYDPEPFTTTYHSFSSDDLYRATQAQAQSGAPGQAAEDRALLLNVVEVSDDYDADRVGQAQSQEDRQQALISSIEGVWNVRLEPKDD